LYGVEEDIIAQQHVDKFNDFVDLEEVDYEDVKMRLFVQSFSGEVKKWFRGLTAGSVQNYQELEAAFLRKWEDKKNPLQLLTQYNSLKRDPTETIQEFSTRFMRIYGSIPADVKPPAGAAKLHFDDSFENDFYLLLRERRSATLTDMIEDVVEVEPNLMVSCKMKGKMEIKTKHKGDVGMASTSQSFDAKFDIMMKKMEKLMERLAVVLGRLREKKMMVKIGTKTSEDPQSPKSDRGNRKIPPISW